MFFAGESEAEGFLFDIDVDDDCTPALLELLGFEKDGALVGEGPKDDALCTDLAVSADPLLCDIDF